MATVRATITASQPSPLVIALHQWGDGSGNGWLPTLQAQPDRFRRPGEAGSGRQLDGAASPSRTVPILAWCRDKPAALLLLTQLESLQGYGAQIVTPAYGTWKYVCFDSVDVQPRAGFGPLISAGIQATYKVLGTVTVERQNDE